MWLIVVKFAKSSVMFEVVVFRKGEDKVTIRGSTYVFVTQLNENLGRLPRMECLALTEKAMNGHFDIAFKALGQREVF